MRLTLRTLLSWKDGMLDAEAAGDIAARVESSEAARHLAARIDDVAANPALSAAAPDAAGFAGDANTTAEYLDNALEPGQLAEFERACFQSDPLLAETAATHETLASWWRDPPPALPAGDARRLLAAARGRSAATGDPRPSVTSRPVVMRPQAASSPPPPAAASRRAPVGAWLLVASAILLLVALVGVLGWSLARTPKRPGPRLDVAARPAAPANTPPDDVVAPAPPGLPADDASIDAGDAAAPAAAGGEPAEPAVAPEPARPRETPVPPASAAASDVVEPAAPRPVAPVAAGPPPSPTIVVTPMPAAPAVAQPAAPGDRRVPQGDALAIAAPAIPAASAVPAPAAAGVAPPAAAGALVPAAPVQAKVDGPAVLLHRPSADARAAWMAGAAGVALELPVELVAPPFGRPAIDVGGTRIDFEPGTRAALGRDADGTLRLEVVFGAAAVSRGERLGVTAGPLAGVVATHGAPVGVEVRIDRVPGAAVDAARRTARVVPAAARVEWRQTAVDGGVRESPLAGIDAVAAVAAGQALVWRSDRPDDAAIDAAGPLPEWLTSRRSGDALDRLAAEALVRRLAAGTAAVPALRELAADRRVEGRLAAAATLAMLGEFAEVALLISAEGNGGLRENQWDRLDVVAVQPALARGPNAAEGLAAALAAQGPPGAADEIVSLARGISDDDLGDGGDADLVAALGSPHLVVRRYAIRNLVEITNASRGDQLRYRADWTDETMREKGIAWWRAQLDRARIRRGAPADR